MIRFFLMHGSFVNKQPIFSERPDHFLPVFSLPIILNCSIHDYFCVTKRNVEWDGRALALPFITNWGPHLTLAWHVALGWGNLLHFLRSAALANSQLYNLPSHVHYCYLPCHIHYCYLPCHMHHCIFTMPHALLYIYRAIYTIFIYRTTYLPYHIHHCYLPCHIHHCYLPCHIHYFYLPCHIHYCYLPYYIHYCYLPCHIHYCYLPCHIHCCYSPCHIHSCYYYFFNNVYITN